MDIMKFIGTTTGFRRIEYNWRDIALYALAVGAGEKDLLYVYEKNMKAIPSFGTVPYWNAVNSFPQRPEPYPGAFVVRNALEKESGVIIRGLHMEHTLIMHRAIDPMKGSLVFEDTITNIYDRGKGRGIIVETRVPVYDEAGNLVCENIANTMFYAFGGFGGEAPPASAVEIPEREPDASVINQLSLTANLLYRLTGDTNRIHVDPEVAQEEGFPRPFMQGLCSFGYACRMAISVLIPGEPERMNYISAQMRSICYPGSILRLDVWEGECSAIFRLVNVEDERPVLDKGVFKWK